MRASDALIAVAGGYVTLSEIGFALKMGKRVIGLETWQGSEGIEHVPTPSEAFEMVLKLPSHG